MQFRDTRVENVAEAVSNLDRRTKVTQSKVFYRREPRQHGTFAHTCAIYERS